jgi:LmbE family N-acetylglucosaminyl deacetylase
MPISRRSLLLAAAAPNRLKIVFTGGHPGDPECGCAGTIARYTALGHDVALLYLNRGEGFCKGADPSQCGVVRAAEAQAACRILGARAVFAGQIDGKAIVDGAHYEEFRLLLETEKADLVFTHWPMDTHRDHRAIFSLVLDAWLRGGKKAALYFYEVAGDTTMFSPTEFVDISKVEPQRRAACYAHASQQPEKWYPEQVALTRRRGAQAGVTQAEGFLRHLDSKPAIFP